MLEIKSYKKVYTMDHKMRKAMTKQDVYCRVAALIESDDCIGSLNPRKRSWGASDKAKVVVAVETHGHRPGSANIQQMENPIGESVCQVLKDQIFPRAHTLIANVKGNIHDVHHGVRPKHLRYYLNKKLAVRSIGDSGNLKSLTEF